ncbi:hypothetical protein FQZ97_978770 [compost metagenome]
MGNASLWTAKVRAGESADEQSQNQQTPCRPGLSQSSMGANPIADMTIAPALHGAGIRTVSLCVFPLLNPWRRDDVHLRKRATTEESYDVGDNCEHRWFQLYPCGLRLRGVGQFASGDTADACACAGPSAGLDYGRYQRRL